MTLASPLSPTTDVIDAENLPDGRPLLHERLEASRVIDRMTPKEYLAFERQGEIRYDFIKGKVVEVPGGTRTHNRISANMVQFVGNALDEAGLDCEVYGSDQKVYIAPDTYRYPDDSIVCTEAEFDSENVLHNPIVIVEVLSPSTERDDRTSKFRDYQRIASLQHYLLIEQVRPNVMHFEKQADESWAVKREYADLSESLTLGLNGKTLFIPLSAIYRRVEFSAANAEATPEQAI